MRKCRVSSSNWKRTKRFCAPGHMQSWPDAQAASYLHTTQGHYWIVGYLQQCANIMHFCVDCYVQMLSDRSHCVTSNEDQYNMVGGNDLPVTLRHGMCTYIQGPCCFPALLNSRNVLLLYNTTVCVGATTLCLLLAMTLLADCCRSRH
jgi:hypothetical protein